MVRKITLLVLAIIVAYGNLLSQDKINIPGFGELPIAKVGDSYQLTLSKYGTYSFKGTIDPLALETEADIDQLKAMPGFNVMSNLGLKDIFLKVSSDGFYINAKADTKGKLKILTEFLKISEPFIDVSVHVEGSNFALGAALDFTANPKIIEISKKSGTSMRMDKLELLAGNDGVGAGISVKANITPRFLKLRSFLPLVIFEKSHISAFMFSSSTMRARMFFAIRQYIL